jgi:hypothetical protein
MTPGLKIEQQQCRKRRWWFETGKKSDKAQGRKRRERKWEGYKGEQKGLTKRVGLGVFKNEMKEWASRS